MIVCDVCPRACKLEEGQTGFCNVRKNVNGENIDSLYGSFYPYPEEYNQAFSPGAYTIVFPGCNLKCWFCNVPFVSNQFNGDIKAWPSGAYRKLTPHEIVERVKKNAGPSRCGFSCGLLGLFGGEPTIHPEYVVEVSRVCHEQGCASKLHTSGYVSEEILRKIVREVDMVSLNVKGSASSTVYQRMNADSNVILRAIEVAWETPRVDGQVRHTTGTVIQNLVGPGLDPNHEETARFGKWLMEKTSPFISVVVEPMVKPRDHFPDHRIELEGVPGEETAAVIFERLASVGETLFDAGLENVWLSLCGVGLMHIPSHRIRPFGT